MIQKKLKWYVLCLREEWKAAQRVERAKRRAYMAAMKAIKQI